MRAPAKPFLAAIGGETLPPPTNAPRQPRKAKCTAADREGTAIAAAETIAQLLPAYVELNRVWAIGTCKASAYHHANAASEAERWGRARGQASDDADAIREASGANAAQRAMSALHPTMQSRARLVEIAPIATVEGLRAKTLAAMWECMPGLADHTGFDFGEDGRTLEVLFRACVRVTGLSKLTTSLEARLQKGEA